VLNLFNAKHMYRCDFCPKKMFIFMGFFHSYGFEMVPGLDLCIYFRQYFPCIRGCQVMSIFELMCFPMLWYWTDFLRFYKKFILGPFRKKRVYSTILVQYCRMGKQWLYDTECPKKSTKWIDFHNYKLPNEPFFLGYTMLC